jgi:hypothetical protein
MVKSCSGYESADLSKMMVTSFAVPLNHLEGESGKTG